MKPILRTLLILVAFSLPISANAGETLKKVEPQFVCMINNTLFNKEQIPVAVEGKTYYGCCPMCKEKLEKSVEARTSADPVSGTTVDKATAIIGAQADGTVHYFENEENLKKYSSHEHSGAQHDTKQCMEGEDCPMHEGMKHPSKDGTIDRNQSHDRHIDDNGEHTHLLKLRWIRSGS